jgi:hypothetical protein
VVSGEAEADVAYPQQFALDLLQIKWEVYRINILLVEASFQGRWEAGTVAQGYNLSPQEAEAGGLWVWGQSGLYCETLSQKHLEKQNAQIWALDRGKGAQTGTGEVSLPWNHSCQVA